MKKTVALTVVLGLFCCVNVFAENKKENTDEINKKEVEQAQKYVEQMTSFAETFMNSDHSQILQFMYLLFGLCPNGISMEYLQLHIQYVIPIT